MGSTLNFSLLEKVLKLCKREKKKQFNENLSVTWVLSSQGSSLLIAIGFFMTFSENVFDKTSMQCYEGPNKEHFVSYVINYCWMHGTYYIEQEMQGVLTPCIVKSKNYDKTPVTQFYIWIPYILAFLFLIARIPYMIWRRLYSERIISIFEGNEPRRCVHNFLYFSYKYNRIHRSYCLLETSNLVFLLFSITFTHIVLNNEFLFYGLEILQQLWGNESVTNPGCHLFPTEVNCRFKAGASPGNINESNFLCILSNNVFNRMFFFVLWIYWVFLLTFSIIGFFFRILRYKFSSISKRVCLNKIENPLQYNKLKEITMTPSEWFFLEYLLHHKEERQQESIVGELCLQIESYPMYTTPS